MAELPRGIQQVKYKNKHSKSSTIKYRIQINRKGLKEDSYFDELEDAKQYLLESKTKAFAEKKRAETESVELRRDTGTVRDVLELHCDDYFQSKKSYNVEKYRLLSSIPNTGLVLTAKGWGTSDSVAHKMIKTVVPDTLFGDLRCYQVTTEIVELYLITRKVKDKVGPATLKKELQHISKAFQRLKRYDPKSHKLMNGINPCANVDRQIIPPSMHKDKPRLTTKSREAIEKGLSEFRNPEMLAVFKLALHTGMRLSEIFNLKRRDVDFSSGLLTLPTTKNGKPRFAGADKDAQDILSERLPDSMDSSFFTLSLEGFKTNWERLQKRTGIKYNFHLLRHEANTLLAERTDMNTAQKALMSGITNPAHYKKSVLVPIEEKLAANRQARGLPLTDAQRLAVIGHADARMNAEYTHLNPHEVSKKRIAGDELQILLMRLKELGVTPGDLLAAVNPRDEG